VAGNDTVTVNLEGNLYPTLANRLVSSTLLIVLPLFCRWSFHISGHVVTDSQLSVGKLFFHQLILCRVTFCHQNSMTLS